MMQSALADRFHLTYHFETRRLPVFELQLAKGRPQVPSRSQRSPRHRRPSTTALPLVHRTRSASSSHRSASARTHPPSPHHRLALLAPRFLDQPSTRPLGPSRHRQDRPPRPLRLSDDLVSRSHHRHWGLLLLRAAKSDRPKAPTNQRPHRSPGHRHHPTPHPKLNQQPTPHPD